MSKKEFGVFFVIVAFSLLTAGCKSPPQFAPNAFIAAELDDVETLKQLDANGADLSAQHPERLNETPLIAAVCSRSTNAAAYLIERGVDVSVRDSTQQTAFMWAISVGDTNTVKLLFQK